MRRVLTIVAAIFIAMIAAPSAAAQQGADGTGDLDLDGISCSISDLGYYTSYFVLGLGAFAPLPTEQVIANSDVNADGLTLTVSDLIAMQRLVLQQGTPAYDTLPMPTGPVTPVIEPARFSVYAFPEIQPSDGSVSFYLRLNGEGYINGFQFHLEYDTAGMVLSDVQAVWPVISQWENFAFNETINGSTASLHIAAYPWDTDGTDSLALAVDDNPYLVMITWEITSPDEPFQKEVQFAWTDCSDNSLAVLDWDGSRFDTPDYLAVSNRVYGATNQEITGLSPRYGGVSDACLSGGSGGAPPQRQIDFHGGLLVYDTLCCDVTGDVRPPRDGNTDLSDVLWYAQFLFLGDFPPPCVASLNVNGDPACNADLADIIYLVNHLFLGGPPPADCRRECDYWE